MIDIIVEQQIDALCDSLDKTTDEAERKIIEAELFGLVEMLNGNTVYLTWQ
jgi:hypothetical protein